MNYKNLIDSCNNSNLGIVISVREDTNRGEGLSFISEIELLGYKGITKNEETILKQLISDSFVIEWNSKIKEKTIDLRRKYSIKLPDAIIASTSLVYDIPLVSADKGYLKIKELDFILIEM